MMVEAAQSITGAEESPYQAQDTMGDLTKGTALKANLRPSSRTDSSHGESVRPRASLLTPLELQFSHLKSGKIKKFRGCWDA